MVATWRSLLQMASNGLRHTAYAYYFESVDVKERWRWLSITVHFLEG